MGSPVVWSQRVSETLRKAPAVSSIVCSRDSGIEHAIRRLESTEPPLMWFWVDRDGDSVEFGDELSSALQRALGSPLYGHGVPVSHGLDMIERELPRIGPLYFVIGWGEHCLSVVERLLSFVYSPSRLLIVSSREVGIPRVGGIASIDPSILTMSAGEAVSAAMGVLSPQVALGLMLEADGRFGSFRSAMLRRLEVPLETTRSQDSDLDNPIDIEARLRDFVKRSQWVEALELAIRTNPDVVADLVEHAGHQLANQGAYDYLSLLLNRLPPDKWTNPKIAYWILASGVATNRALPAQRVVESSAESRDNPDIRATLAVLRPTEQMATDTAAALEEAESPITLRAHAFALGFDGNREAPVPLFRRAMRMAEELGAHHLVVACAIDIANQETALGRYSQAIEWANWALAEYYRRGLREELRRQTAITGVVYPSILKGDLDSVGGLIGGVGPYAMRLGVPEYESVASTLGDWEFVHRRFESAAIHYRRVYDSCGIDQSASAALDSIRCCLACDDDNAAHEIALHVHAIAQSSTRQELSFSELGLGMALYRKRPIAAAELLESSIEGLRRSCFAVLQAQAAIWLSIVRASEGRTSSVKEILMLGADGLQELGDSGWALLSAFNPMTPELTAIWDQEGHVPLLRVLGSRTIDTESGTANLSLRFCEILVLLATHPEGLSRHKLQLLLFGDRGTEANVKSALSRLRRIVPITQPPYRIESALRVDVSDLVRCLASGDVQGALALYRGPLLPDSEAPGIVELRDFVEESLRQSVMGSRDPEALIQLATVLEDDLELWEVAKGALLPGDHRRPLVNARIRRVRANWQA